MNILLSALEETLHDTWSMIFLLYIAYLIIEYFERKDSKDDSLFWNLQKWGPAFGALLGLLPQCGFSILAAMLFVQRNITLGTLVSVFIATSDEAIPVLVSEFQLLPDLVWLLVFKLILAVSVGFIVDKVLFPHQKILYFQDMPEEEEEEIEEEDQKDLSGCPCCYPQYPIWKSALLRTLKIYAFVFAVSFALTLILSLPQEENLSAILLTGNIWQPVAAALFGFIPNCAATVVLCQLFAAGQLSFASLFAGLVTNAGLGLVVLFQYERNKKWFWYCTIIMLVAALISGYIILWFS